MLAELINGINSFHSNAFGHVAIEVDGQSFHSLK